MSAARCVVIPWLAWFCVAGLVGGCGERNSAQRATAARDTAPTAEPSRDTASTGDSAMDVHAAVESSSDDSVSDVAARMKDDAPSDTGDITTKIAPAELPESDPNDADPNNAEPNGPDANGSDPVAADTTNDSSAESEPSPSDPTDAAVPSEPAFRVLLPTTSGPLLVEVDIRIGDQPLMDAFDQRVQQVIEAVSASSELTWPNLFQYVSADPQQFGRSMVNSGQSRNMIRLYDKNRNNKPDHNEVAKFLFRTSRFNGPFRLFGSDSYRGVNRSQSALFNGLDRNKDRVLEKSEIESAAESINRLDQNGDLRIEYVEVVPPPPDNDPAWNNRRSSRWGEVAMDLSGYIDWKMLSYTLDESSRSGVFGSSPGLIARIDQNRDESVDPEEARSLLGVRPDVRLLIRYPAVATGQAVQVEIVSVAEQIRPSVSLRSSGSRAKIDGGSLCLLVQAKDISAARNLIPPEAFAALDANNDGGLDETEIPPAALREYSFEDLDADKDGKLTVKEFNEGMAPKSPIWSVQVRSRGAESRDAMFCWLDENQDYILSSREVGGIAERLSELATADGTVKPTDIPDSFLLQFGRGDPNQDGQLFSTSVAPTATPRNDSRPRWAQSMDSNRDGDIGPLEFPGTAEQFESLDANNDGYIDTLEAGGSMDTGQ